MSIGVLGGFRRPGVIAVTASIAITAVAVTVPSSPEFTSNQAEVFPLNDNIDPRTGKPVVPGGFSQGGQPITPSSIVNQQTVYPPPQKPKAEEQTNYPYNVHNGGKK